MPFTDPQKQKEYQRKYNAANRDKINQRMKEYRAANRDKVKQQRKEWNDANRDKRKEYNAANRDKIKEYQIKRRYGIAKEQVKQMYISQDGCCAICGDKFDKDTLTWNIDHNHNTNMVRQLLCGPCNIGIGGLKEDVSILAKAIDYINKWNKTI